jgi:tetratricopeptide (TPR) repeat protein
LGTLRHEPDQTRRVRSLGIDHLGDRGWLSTQACKLADALYALGRYQEAGQWAQRSLELGHQKDLATQLPGLAVRARLLAREGDSPAALALAHQVEELAKTSDSPIDHGDAALNLAQVMSLTGDRAGAQEAARRAVGCYQRRGATAYVARAQRLAAGWTPRNEPAPGDSPAEPGPGSMPKMTSNP